MSTRLSLGPVMLSSTTTGSGPVAFVSLLVATACRWFPPPPPDGGSDTVIWTDDEQLFVLLDSPLTVSTHPP